jgi:acetyltransferase-like isoleucine patch superfamily enzyme
MMLARMNRFVKGFLLTLLWRARGVEIPDRLAVEGLIPSLAADGSVRLGSRVAFRSHRFRSRIGAYGTSVIDIGDRTFFNSGVTIESSIGITIGRNCLIGDRVTIQDSNFHEVELGAGVTRRPVRIGDNVWLCAGSVILPGVEIGDHTVVGAGAVVTRSLPARVLAAGNPARIVRELNAPDGYNRK